MLDNTEFEWVSADATPVLLYPGFTSDDALVEPGEIVAAAYDSSDGIALYGSRDKVLSLLLRLADAVRNAPPVPATEACIAATTDPTAWKPGPLTESLPPTTRAWPLCDSETPQPIAADPRLATCTDCVHAFNAHGPPPPSASSTSSPTSPDGTSVNDSKPARRPKPLPDIGTTYAERSEMWRHHVLGARPAHIWTVTSHIDGRVAFNDHTEPTFSTYWIGRHLMPCHPDGSPTDPTYVERERTSLQEMERHHAALPPLDQVINELIADKLRP